MNIPRAAQHSSCYSPLWIRRCSFRWCLYLKALPHSVHLNLRFPAAWLSSWCCEREREKEIHGEKNAQTSWGESSVNNHNRSAWQQATSPTAPVANEASCLSTPTSVERLQAAEVITERITYLLISWLLGQRRHAFRIWQPRKSNKWKSFPLH